MKVIYSVYYVHLTVIINFILRIELYYNQKKHNPAIVFIPWPNVTDVQMDSMDEGELFPLKFNTLSLSLSPPRPFVPSGYYVTAQTEKPFHFGKIIKMFNNNSHPP